MDLSRKSKEYKINVDFPHYLHMWPRGMIGVSKDDNSVHIMQVSLCGCTNNYTLDSSCKVRDVRSRRRHDVVYAIVFGAIVNSCLVGLYVHFIPCLWWTCDWGEHDGEGPTCR